MGLSVGIFRNFRDYCRIVRTEFSGLLSDSLDKILGLGGGLVLISGPMSSGFVVCFGIRVIW